MNLKVRGVTDRSIDLEWEGSVVLTDFLVTYTPSSAGGKKYAARVFIQAHTRQLKPNCIDENCP